MASNSLLAFDTATEYCSVALETEEGIVERTEKLGNAHSESLLPWIDDMVKKASLQLKDIEGIIFSAGPGSFTGLRIACGVAQGLAWGIDKKVLPASTLAAMAFRFKDKAPRVAVINDARMNECYAAVYAMSDNGFKVIQSEHLIKPEKVGLWLKQMQAGFVAGTAIGVYEMDIEIPSEYAHPSARDMIEWYRATQSVSEKLWTDPDKAAPLYIRDHVALTINERQQGAKL